MQKFGCKKCKAFPKNSTQNKSSELISLDIKSSSKKFLNINDFIHQKNKFKIHNFFDEKCTKDFLSSKEKALREIQLDENIENTEYHSNNSSLIKEKEKNIIKFDEKHKIRKEKTNSPKSKNRKVAKSQKQKKEKKLKYINNHKNNSNDSNINDNDSQEDYIYKIILDNANESDDKLMKKLTQEIKRVEINKKKKGKDKLEIRKSLTNKQKNIIKNVIFKDSDKKLNPFNFSEYAKSLMKIDNIEVSSINDEKPIAPTNNQIKTIGTFYTSTKKSSNNKNYFNDQETIGKNFLNNKDINQSLINILSDLIQ